MKRVSVFLLIFFVFTAILPAGINRSEAAVAFKDVPSNAWYYGHVKYVTDDPRQLMVGYAGNFGSLDNLTVEQFIKITVAAAGKSVTVPKGQYWGDVYTPIGLELGFVLPGEFTNYKRDITRAEMARIIIRALPSITSEKDISYDINLIKSKMVDFESIPVDLKDYVCKAYKLGILVGGADKKFNPNGSLSRASAAAVIHNMLDKAVRSPLEETSQIWSDAEFEAYMKSSDGTYINTNAISKIEGRKIYWKQLKGDPVLIPETTYPGINSNAYNLVKIMAYHTVKTKGYMQCSFQADIGGGIFSTDFYVNKKNANYMPPGSGNIYLMIFIKPTISWTAEKYMPGKQKSLSSFMWQLGALYNGDDIKGYEWGMDRTKFVWTHPRYEIMLKQMCVEVYGYNQGTAFYDLSINEMDKFFLDPDNYTVSYQGINNQIGCELFYYFPTEDRKHEFWTDRPVEKK